MRHLLLRQQAGIESLDDGAARDRLANEGDLLPAIAQSYRALRDQRQGVVDAVVTTAVPLSAELRDRLAAELAKALAKTPRLAEVVEPGILGGVVIEVDGKKFDSSVSSQLRRLEANLLERATNEIVRGREAQA